MFITALSPTKSKINDKYMNAHFIHTYIQTVFFPHLGVLYLIYNKMNTFK